jgi:hypothetical protein
MTAAIFGLLGVIVGGVLNGLVSAWLERRARRSDGQTGARLVRSELVFFLAAAKRSASTPLEDLPQLRRATTELWQDNRSVLARSLNDRQWARVARAYAYVDALLSLLVFDPDGKLAPWRIEEGIRCSNSMIIPIQDALKALAAGDDEGEGTDYKYRPSQGPLDDADRELIERSGGMPPEAFAE